MADAAKHIVHIIPTLRYGGAERFVVDLANRVDRSAFQTSIITFNDDLPLQSQLDGVTVTVVPKRGKLSLHLISDLKQTLQEIEADLVHTHLFGGDVWGRIAAKQLRLPVVTTEHNLNIGESFIKHLVKGLLSKKTDIYTAPSHAVAQYMTEHYGIALSDIEVVPHGIDVNRFADCQDVPFSQNSTPRILLIGRLTEQKGFDIALEALHGLTDREWTASLYGNGALKEQLEIQAEAYGLADRLSFYGATPSVPSVLCQHDIVIVPSRWEGLGIIVMEAMAAKRVVIGAETGGIPEILDDRTGYLFRPEHADALRETLLDIFDHREDAVARARHAQDHALLHFGIETMVARYEALYHTL